MPKPKKIFYKLIQCSQCNNNFRYIKDRSIPKYICGGYARKTSNCKRISIKEEDLLRIIEAYHFKNRLEFIPTHDFIKQIVDKIYVSEEEIKIVYKNGEESKISNNIYKA